jgi:hypothetical protein
MTTVWKFATAKYAVTLEIEPSLHRYYDGVDEDGSIQDAINRGDMVLFDSTVSVWDRQTDKVLGQSSLGNSVYELGLESEFWTGHRDRDPKNRNCTINPCQVGHYFPDMIREAIAEARQVCDVRQKMNLDPLIDALAGLKRRISEA